MRRIAALALVGFALVASCGDTSDSENGDGGASIGPGGSGSTGCATSLDCASEPGGRTICNDRTGECVECVADADCGDDEACVANVCRPPCDSDNDCTPLGLLCDRDAGHCVRCLEDAHCPERTHCQTGECVPDGGDGGAGPGGAPSDGGMGAMSAGGVGDTGGQGGGGGATGGRGGTAGSGATAGSGDAAGTGGSAGSGTAGTAGSPVRPSCPSATASECRGESCCTSLAVPGGTFRFGRGSETCSNCTAGCPSTSSCDLNETPEHDATIAGFVLDKYEVTVGRFRRFVEAYDGTPPAEGAGAIPTIPGSGWQASWNAGLPVDSRTLSTALTTCESNNQCMTVGACDTYTWTPSAGANELLPINCESWYEAFAFCIWDGGRLPSEAELEYVSGGNQNLVYPWGNEPPPDGNHAVYDCLADGMAGCSGLADIPAVGSRPAGAGPFGHLDLLGSVSEWAIDFLANYASAACTGCVNLTSGSSRIRRGSSWLTNTNKLRTAARIDGGVPPVRLSSAGIRCVRQP